MAALLRPEDIQSSDDKARALAEKREARIRRAIATMLAGIASLFGRSSVLVMISGFDQRGLMGILDGPEANDLFVAGYQPIADTFIEAAQMAADDANAAAIGGTGTATTSTGAEMAVETGGGSGGASIAESIGGAPRLLTYDPMLSAENLQILRSALVGSLTDSSRQAVQSVLIGGLRRGDTAETIATRLREVVSLNGPQQRAAENYRRMLETGDRQVLRRAMRDKKFDARVVSALQGKTALKPEEIDRMVDAYVKRQLDYRATMIARTESMQAAVSGMREPYRQAVASGRLLDREVRRFWLTAADELVCPVCSSVPILNPDGVGVNEPYNTISGPSDGPLAHTLCRCNERFTTDLTRLHNQPF